MRGTIIQTDIQQISVRPVQISGGYLTAKGFRQEAVRCNGTHPPETYPSGVASQSSRRGPVLNAVKYEGTYLIYLSDGGYPGTVRQRDESKT